MTSKKLKRPHGIGDAEWAAIEEVEERLRRAREDKDWALVVGSAKELCESIARVVIGERGGTIGDGADMHELATAAHRLLEFQPGDGVASDPEVRKIAQGLKSILIGISELRNRRGTGHGRAGVPSIVDEHPELAYSVAYLWSEWALRRLEPYVRGNVTALVRDLEGETFRRGQLAKRLEYANLPRQSPADQARVGTAVARRASRGTFVVIEDGIEAVEPGNSDLWPEGYLRGLIFGLFLDVNGHLDLKAWKVREAARLVTGLANPAPILTELAEAVSTKGRSQRVATDDSIREEVLVELRTAVEDAPAIAKPFWQMMVDGIQPAGDGEFAG